MIKRWYIRECDAAKAHISECAGLTAVWILLLRTPTVGPKSGVKPPHSKSCGCAECFAKRECFLYALVTIFHSYASRRSGGRRGCFAQTVAARGHHSPVVCRDLFVSADWTTHCFESDADCARRNEPHWRPGILSARPASGRTLAGVGTLERDRR